MVMMGNSGAAFSLPNIHLLCLMLLNFAGNYQLVAAVASVIGREFSLSRHDFPPGFLFGAATSAYQVEGAAFDDGRKASIFDTFAHSGFLSGNGDVAADGYRRYKEDVHLMVETGLDAYRFSISWSRLLPNGRGRLNPKGLEYYNNLIDELISNGIQPHATLMHLDVPQALEDEYGGFLNRRIVEDFTTYADFCFREFGDRVPYWTTINEANIFILGGYDMGYSPPGRCSFHYRHNCTGGNSTTEPYIAAHNVLLAHASAAKLYKEKYKAKQQGSLGLNLFAYHFVPYTDTTEDAAAAQRSHDFFIGLFMHPLMYGDYPIVVKRNAGKKLPAFTKEESKLVKGAFDFIGINYYTFLMTKDNSISLTMELRDFLGDMAVTWIYVNGTAPRGSNPYANAPWGLQAVLELFKQVYNNPPIYIHENGQLLEQNISGNDSQRVEYLQGHIGAVFDAVRNGSNTKGYFVWSFIDLYEVLFGYNRTFGLYYVNFSDPTLSRHPRLSQRWYSGFLKGKNVAVHEEVEQALSIFPTSPADVNGLNLLGRPEIYQHKSSQEC